MRLLAILLGLIPTVVVAQSVDLANPDFIARGAVGFAKSCAVGYCHGSEGAAGRGPELRGREWNPRDLFDVTHDGLAGTSMPAWKGILPEEEIWAITAYIVSLGSSSHAETVVELGAESTETRRELSVDAAKGKALFFDLTNETRCGICHKVGPDGSATIGPNLAQSAVGKSKRQLLTAIRKPGAAVAFGYSTTEVRLSSGEVVSGILADRGEHIVRLYDMETLPPVLRSFYGDEVRRVRGRKRSQMPAGDSLGYSAEQLNAIVTYLSESR